MMKKLAELTGFAVLGMLAGAAVWVMYGGPVWVIPLIGAVTFGIIVTAEAIERKPQRGGAKPHDPD